MTLKVHKSCGSCLYFRHQPPPGESQPHEKAGYYPYSKPCTIYEPAAPLVSGNTEKLGILGLIRSYVAASDTAEELEAVAQLLSRAAALRARGHQFMQKMFFKWRGSPSTDYLDNWVTCYLLHITATDDYWLTSANNEVSISVTAVRERGKPVLKNLLTVEQFKPLYQNMIDRQRFCDPAYKPIDYLKATAEAQAVPDLEQIIENADLDLIAPKALKALKREMKGKKP